MDSSSKEDETPAETHSDEEYNTNLASRSLTYVNTVQRVQRERDQQNASQTPRRPSSTFRNTTPDKTGRDIRVIRQQDALTWKTQGTSRRSRSATNSSNRGSSLNQSRRQLDSNHRSPDAVIYGQAETVQIKAMDQKHRYSYSNQSNCVVSGIFVTRLNPHTTVKDIQKHIRQETGTLIKPEKLKTKYNTYASFYIPCEQSDRMKFLDKALWPKKSLVKLFYN